MREGPIVEVSERAIKVAVLLWFTLGLVLGYGYCRFKDRAMVVHFENKHSEE